MEDNLSVQLATTSTSSPTCPFPVISWKSSDSILVTQMLAADEGVMLIEDMNVCVPMSSVRNIFCELYEHPSLINQFEPKSRGPYKRKSLTDESIDQKVILDLSTSTIKDIYEKDIKLSTMWTDTADILQFTNDLQQNVVPRLVRLAAAVITDGDSEASSKLGGIYYGVNQTLRLVDFFPISERHQRCGAHRDMSTFTLIFQDRLQGGLEVFQNRRWVPVPATSEVVLMWGWSTLILSNGRISAPLHRVIACKADGVRNGKSPRRNEVALYVMPDWDAYLHPVLIRDEQFSFHPDALEDLTVRKFKTLFEAEWHQREGTTTEEEDRILAAKKNAVGFQQTQDEGITNYLFDVTDN